MATEIEQGYESQGFKLPDGWTWERVGEERARLDIKAIYVPLGSTSGVVGWGVPMTDGGYMTHSEPEYTYCPCTEPTHPKGC